ncbi:Protein translocase subunit SecF [uncultured Gammaproteobacteria bacterium]
MYRLRLVPDDTRIPFMKGRYAGLIVSAVLSIASVILYFYPGMNLGIDFRGGILIEARTAAPINFAEMRTKLSHIGLGKAGLQEYGSAQDVLIRYEQQPGGEQAQQKAVEVVRTTLAKEFPGTQLRRVEAVGASVSGELFNNGMLALGLAMLAMLGYIWFRFEWQFGLGAVITLLLDVTKTVGFFVITNMQFNLTSVAAILTVMGFSINDKVVVYDRVRENLRIYKKMSLRELIDLSINETLNRTLGTSMAAFLATLPLALFGGEALQDFAVVILFGIVIGTSSSIFIAAPILLFLGENKLRRGLPESAAAGGEVEAPEG